jgi:hypothetical protein
MHGNAPLAATVAAQMATESRQYAKRGTSADGGHRRGGLALRADPTADPASGAVQET